MKIAVRAGAVLAIAALLAGCGGNTSSSGNIVKIGIDLPISGADASVGVSTEQGALLAIQELQKKALPGGIKIEAAPLDDAILALVIVVAVVWALIVFPRRDLAAPS